MSRPNIVMIVADDHAPAAIGAYGARVNRTPNLDSLAADGLRLDRCFCTNSICTPARASIMTGKYSHTTGIRTLDDVIDHDREGTIGMWLQGAGYQTAMIGKWHLGHGGSSDPRGFDYWNVLPVQGAYRDPTTIEMGREQRHRGYVTDLLTDLSLAWLDSCEGDRPFFLYLGNKAPHDNFEPHPRHLDRYLEELPEPLTLRDDFADRSPASFMSTARVDRMHLKDHLPEPPPDDLTGEARLQANYQSYMRNYYRCVDAVDENVGRILAWLEASGHRDNTIVIYTSDHGFFLGDHGWYDKRFMYEEGIRIPFLMRWPAGVRAGTVSDRIALNVDFAPSLLEWAGIDAPDGLQGRSLAPLAAGAPPSDWRTSFYYRYWMHLAHFNIPAHYGVRTERFKLIHFYGRALGAAGAIDRDSPPVWELYDLESDPMELHNRYGLAPYAETQAELLDLLAHWQAELGDLPEH